MAEVTTWRITTLGELCEAYGRAPPGDKFWGPAFSEKTQALEIAAEKMHEARLVESPGDLPPEALERFDVGSDFDAFDSTQLGIIGIMAGLPAVRFRCEIRCSSRSQITVPRLGDLLLGATSTPRKTICLGSRAADGDLSFCVKTTAAGDLLCLDPEGPDSVTLEYAFLPTEAVDAAGLLTVVSSEKYGDEWYIHGAGPADPPREFGRAVKGDST